MPTNIERDAIKVYKGHYLIGDKRYDRVTSVLDYFTPPELSDWKDRLGAKEAKQVSKTAKAIGTRVDGLVQKYNLTKRYQLTSNDSPAIDNCMKAYARWYETEKPNILAMQTTLHNDELMVAGTLDIEIDNAIIDVKTSSAIRLTYWLQLAMYSYMHNKKAIGVLRLDKFTADYEYKVIAYDDRLVGCYIGLLNYYRYITSYKIKKEKEVIDNGSNNATYTEIEARLGIYKPKVLDNWGEWHREV